MAGVSLDEVCNNDQIRVVRLCLPAVASGFQNFLTPWLIQDKVQGLTILVDPGPSATAKVLVQLLGSISVDHLDFVLLTHVHIDHAGGTGDLIASFPEARVLVHPAGRPHLLNPEKLWQASIKTLGALAYSYGPIKPVPEEAIADDTFGVPGWTVIDTPGHAPHHQAYLVKTGDMRVLFPGEAAGVYLGSRYLRPATPPRFFFDAAIQSIDKLANLNPSAICFGHYGFAADDCILGLAREQLGLWSNVISEVLLDRKAHTQPEPMATAVSVATARLLAEDPFLSEFASFPEEVACREKSFIENSVMGIGQYLVSRMGL